jgi:dTDP-4-dehydrorhamnose reductase
MKKILIVGSTGKIGSFLLNSLKFDYTIYTISRSNSDNYNFYYDFDRQLGDLNLLKKIDFDIVINCLGILPSSNLSEESYHKVNSESVNILASFINSTCKYIFMSTISIYGESIADRDIIETDKAHPKNLYAKSKLQGELFSKKQFLSHYIFRIPPVYLNFEDKTIYKRIIKTNFLEMKFGDDSQLHSYCSLSTLLTITKQVIEHNYEKGIFHIADKKKYSNNFLKEKLKINSLITFRVYKTHFKLLLRLSKWLKINYIENKINEIYFKLFCNNVYSTNKIYNQINKE